MIEKTVNNEGQEQIINSLKMEGKYLQVRLIKTKRWNKPG